MGSEIIKLAGEIKGMIAQGEEVHNFTIGDFDPKLFPIPTELLDGIVSKYKSGHTNYPAANGMAELREAVQFFLKHYGQLDYNAEQFYSGVHVL